MPGGPSNFEIILDLSVRELSKKFIKPTKKVQSRVVGKNLILV
jgi:hypothetical protein